MADDDSQAPSQEEKMMSRSDWVDFIFTEMKRETGPQKM